MNFLERTQINSAKANQRPPRVSLPCNHLFNCVKNNSSCSYSGTIMIYVYAWIVLMCYFPYYLEVH